MALNQVWALCSCQAWCPGKRALVADNPARCHLVIAEVVPLARAKRMIRLSLVTGASSWSKPDLRLRNPAPELLDRISRLSVAAREGELCRPAPLSLWSSVPDYPAGPRFPPMAEPQPPVSGCHPPPPARLALCLTRNPP